jgi:hypothetical protein
MRIAERDIARWILAVSLAGLGACGDSGSHDAVSPCPTDDGGDDIGLWTEVSPPEFHALSNMQTWAVAVNPVDGSLYASAGNITSGGKPPRSTGVYKSTDCGASWTLYSKGAHGADLKTGAAWALLVDPKAPETMFIDNGYGDNCTLFRSTNGGYDWKPLDIDPCGVTQPAFAQAVSIDPTNHLHVALTFHETCNATGTTACSVPLPTTPMCLSQSTDGGETWSYINGPTAAQGVTGWQEAASLLVLGPQSYFLSTPGNGGWITYDGGNTWTNEIATINLYGSYAGSAHLAPDGTIYVGVANDAIYSSRADATHAAGEVWTRLTGSPGAGGATVITDDGVNLYASVNDTVDKHPFYWAPLSNPTKWKNMPKPSDPDPANEFAFDAKHQMLYAASGNAGVWRVRLR